MSLHRLDYVGNYGSARLICPLSTELKQMVATPEVRDGGENLKFAAPPVERIPKKQSPRSPKTRTQEGRAFYAIAQMSPCRAVAPGIFLQISLAN